MTTTQDDSGEDIETWIERFQAWADVVPVKGNEKYSAAREMASIVYKFTIMYNSAIVPTDSIVYNGQRFNIINLAPLGDRNNEVIECLAEVLESDGL